MQRRSTATTILGTLALTATLALGSTGVRVVRAADDIAAPADPAAGAICQAGTIDGAKEIAEYLQDVQRLSQSQAAGPRSDDETIVLNNRGYNLGSPQMAFPMPNEHTPR